MRSKNKQAIIIAILIFFIFAKISSNTPVGYNDQSRLAAIVAISKYNKLNIDDTQFKLIGDRVNYKGLNYSSKPPVLSLAVGGFVKGLGLVSSSIIDNQSLVYKISTILTTALPLALIFLIFRLFLFEKENLFFSLYAIFGTLLFSYSQYLNNHILESLIMLCLFTLFIKTKELNNGISFLFGLFLGLLFALDVTFGVVVIPLTVIFLVIKYRSANATRILLFVTPLLLLVTSHFYLNYLQFETLLLPQLRPDIYLNYEGSKWYGINSVENIYRDSFLLRWFNYTFGTFGLFLYQPLLLIALIPIFKKGFLKDRDRIYVLLIVFFYILFNALLQKDYGGSSFGPRRFLPLIPLLYYFVVKDITGGGHLSRVKTIIVVFLFATNFYISILGFLNPWENWNYYNDGKRYLYFPLLFTLREVLQW